MIPALHEIVSKKQKQLWTEINECKLSWRGFMLTHFSGQFSPWFSLFMCTCLGQIQKSAIVNMRCLMTDCFNKFVLDGQCAVTDSVSYTHLDVYKRQHTHSIDLSKFDSVAHNRTDSATSGSLWRSLLKVKAGLGCKVNLYDFTYKKPSVSSR